MGFWAPLLLSLALSIDGFAVGLSYGLKKIKVTLWPVMLITFCAVPAMAVSMLGGRLLAELVSFRSAGMLGGAILVLIGFWQLAEGLKKYKKDPVLVSINLKSFGLVLQVIRDPAHADRDSSGDISLGEALLLGAALNLDVIGAGFGAGMAGYSYLIIPVVTATLFFSLSLGLRTSDRFRGFLWGGKGHILPGIIIVFLGLVNILR